MSSRVSSVKPVISHLSGGNCLFYNTSNLNSVSSVSFFPFMVFAPWLIFKGKSETGNAAARTRFHFTRVALFSRNIQIEYDNSLSKDVLIIELIVIHSFLYTQIELRAMRYVLRESLSYNYLCIVLFSIEK